MDYTMTLVYIKDLLIFQSNSVYKLIESNVENARRNGVELGELVVNSYMYKHRSLDIGCLIPYIRALDNMIKVFRDLYDDEIYTLRLENLITDEVYNNINGFHNIFNAINNTFNAYLCDQFLFEDFGIYQSQTSLETILALYETYNDYFIMSLRDYVNPNILKISIMNRSTRYIQYIYDKIFEQFEDIYLPFY